MARLKTLTSLVPKADGRTVRVEPKQVDPFYRSPKYLQWRETVIARAGRRCEARKEDGGRCTKAEPRHRMFANHIRERRDGGADLDPSNGECLCGHHHSLVTAKARAARAGR